MSPTLLVPPVFLTYEVYAPGVTFLEKPVTVICPLALFPDGTQFAMNHLAGGKAGLFVFRQQSMGSELEVWDQKGPGWQKVSGADMGMLEPSPLNLQEGVWKGLLIAAGQKDSTGQEAFSKDAGGGYPRYTVQAYFKSTYAGNPISGMSPPSPPISFVSVLDANIAGIQTGEDETLQDATVVRLYLRNQAHRRLGLVEIRASGEKAEIEIKNFTETGFQLAAVRLLDTGEIRLEPATFQKVIIDGDLETEHIVYRNNSGLKVTLP
jgi:hypothetical protein